MGINEIKSMSGQVRESICMCTVYVRSGWNIFACNAKMKSLKKNYIMQRYAFLARIVNGVKN